MFYEPGKTDHGLPYDPYKACVIPRPIGWISTVSPTPHNSPPIYNLAPYSQFNNLTFDPPYVMFASNQTLPPSSINPSTNTHTSHSTSHTPTAPAPTTQRSPGHHRKDTVHNAESTGYFCWQLATYALRSSVNASAESLPYTTDEFAHSSLEKTWSTILPIKIPMVAASPIRFECQYHSTLRLPGNPPLGTVDVVIGRVLGVHIDDGVLGGDGKIDIGMTLPIARLGYYDYAVIRPEACFQMVIPGDARQGGGLEGSTKKNRGLIEEDEKVVGGTESGKVEGKDEAGQLKRVQSQDVIAVKD